jgi:lysophospholipase L1-like esterase
MIVKKYCFVIAFSFFCINCAFSQRDLKTANTLPATALKLYGRYIVNNGQNVGLISSAVHFGFSFEGNECQIFASIPQGQDHNYLQYELDGKYQKRIKISANSDQPVIIVAQNEGKHSVWVYKATEAATGAIFIQKITGKNVKGLPGSSAPLIEFIGNSITCGAAADASEVPCGTGEYHDHHNAYYAYGPRVARTLGVNYILSSVSGIGVYRNWNSDGPTMPQVYEKVDFGEETSQRWNFKKYTPKVVSIALGTNDFSKGDGIKKRLPFDSAEFVRNYIKFVELIKLKYPKAQIALLSSPMIGGTDRLTLQNCLKAVKDKVDSLHASNKPLSLFFFEPMEPHGCSGHPDVNDHAILASQLMPFFKKLLR